MFKKSISVLLAILLLCGVFNIVPISASAQEADVAEDGAELEVAPTGATQADYVSWITDRGDEGWWEDVDGVYGCQCVDLVKAYYRYFGYGTAYHGHAYEYQWDHTPTGSDWYYSDTPIPGSVFVQSKAAAKNDTGHVGLVYAIDDTFLYTVETNIGGNGNGYDRAEARYNKRYRSGVSTYINPTYDNPNPPSNPWISASSKSIPVGGSISFTFGADGATNYWIGIDRNGSRIITEHVSSGVNYTFNEAGDYSAYITAYNYVGGVDSSRVYFTVNPKGHVMSESEGAGRTIPDGDYWICSKIAQDYFIDIPYNNFDTQDATNLQTWQWGSGIPPIYDVFHFEYLNNGFYLITQMNTRKAIDVENGSLYRGANVHMYGVNKATAQQWSIEKTDGGYKLRARCNGFCMDINSGIYECGTNVLTWEDHGGTMQRFSFIPYSPNERPLSDGIYRFNSLLGDTCYLDANGSPGNYVKCTNIQLWNSAGDTFQVEYVGDGYYRIYETTSKLSMEIVQDGNYLDKNKSAMLYEKNSSKGQFWKIRKNSDGTYSFINKLSGYYLDVYDGETANGTNVHAHPYNGSNAQKWKPLRVLQSDMISVSDVLLRKKSDEVSPEISVKVDGNTLIKNTDYTIKLSSDVESGKGTVTITGKNNYCDTVTKEYSIDLLKLIGDVDGDGEVSVVDATFIQRYNAQLQITIDVNTLLKCGDIDGDGEVTILDSTLIQRYTSQMPISYPVGEPI